MFEDGPDNRLVARWSGQTAVVSVVVGHVVRKQRLHFEGAGDTHTITYVVNDVCINIVIIIIIISDMVTDKGYGGTHRASTYERSASHQ